MSPVGPEDLALGGLWFVAFLLSLTCHEAAHAWMALRGGDPTAYESGQVSLNPIPHMQREPFGTVLVPILSFALNGWMMGWASAPYDPLWAARHPRRAALMSLAGPLANLAIAVLAGVAIRVGLEVGLFAPGRLTFTGLARAASASTGAGAATFLSILFSLNLLLFVLNLIPVPPLDGSGALGLVLPEETALRFRELMHQPLPMLIGIVIAFQAIGPLFRPVYRAAAHLVYVGLL